LANTRLRKKYHQIKGWLYQKRDFAHYQFPLPWSRSYISKFWDNQVDYIYKRWGHADHDFEVLTVIFDLCKPNSILGVGCGTGRLFPFYIENEIVDILGIDIS
jgi:cyclopropane fatty-acyl-phospholipid synthase-like methyltransferase